jgi:putative CocE/NonD family hydrolase
MGAWNHNLQITPTCHNPAHAQDVSIFKDQFEWLYSVVAKGIIPKGEAKIYFIEDDQWRTFDRWPIKNVRQIDFYFTKQPSPDKPAAYLLNQNEQKQQDTIQYLYDPQYPVISNGGETLFTSKTRRGCQLQPEIGYRKDVISFISPVLTQNLQLAGRIRVMLNVSTDVDDTSCPDGLTYNIRSGITTLAYRNNPLGDRQTYTPGTKLELTIQSTPITWNVKAGNRIRVDIASSNFPEYSIHSNYAGIWAFQNKTRTAKQTIFVGAENNSEVSFEILQDDIKK